MKKIILISIIIIMPAAIIAGEYDRDDWPHWADLDRDCQNARMEILLRDTVRPVTYKTDRFCKVKTGMWVCPYSGLTHHNASDIDIDHMIPLANAHLNGAENWTREQRKVFANDPENLFSVDDGTNQSKGAQGPEEWRPPLKSYWPTYARKWIYIKEKYGLGYAPGELEALGEMLGN